MSDEYDYAERMYPAPIGLGIAEPDRAVSSVAREVRGGELLVGGYHRPEWPSNKG